MSKLTTLYEQLNANYEEYLADNSQLGSLAKNISLFRKIPKEELVQSLTKAGTGELEISNGALFIVAKSYTAYAFAKKNENASKCLDSAARCYSLVSKYVVKIPPFSLSLALGQQHTEAEFYKHKTKFNQAKMELFFIKKQMKNSDIELNIMENSLHNVIETCTKFQKTLATNYKDPVLRDKFSINAQFLDSIQTEHDDAEKLLSIVQKRMKKRTTTEQPSDSLAPRTNDPEISKTIPIPEEDENFHGHPRKKRTKRIIENMEESTNDNDTSNPIEEAVNTHELSSSKRRRQRL